MNRLSIIYKQKGYRNFLVGILIFESALTHTQGFGSKNLLDHLIKQNILVNEKQSSLLEYFTNCYMT